jgi:hypothetical protein
MTAYPGGDRPALGMPATFHVILRPEFIQFVSSHCCCEKNCNDSVSVILRIIVFSSRAVYRGEDGWC